MRFNSIKTTKTRAAAVIIIDNDSLIPNHADIFLIKFFITLLSVLLKNVQKNNNKLQALFI